MAKDNAGVETPAKEQKTESTENQDSASKQESGKQQSKEKEGDGSHPLASFDNFSVNDLGEEGESVDDKTDDSSKEKDKPEDATGKESKVNTDSDEDEDKDDSTEKDGSDDKSSFDLEVPKDEEGKSEDGDKQETWQDIGKSLGLDVKGENFEDFEKAYKAKQEGNKSEAIEKAKKDILENPDEILKDVDQNTRNLIRLANSGSDVSALMAPANQIDKYVAYPDEQLVRENLKSMEKAPGEKMYTDDRIEEKITKLQEDGEVGDEADSIREDLYSQKRAITEELIQAEEQSKEQVLLDQSKKIETQTTAFKESVNSVDTFMGGKVGDEAKTFVNKLWDDGKVHKMFQDPQKVADFVFYNTFGEQALKQSKTDSYSEGSEKSKQGLHNSPPALNEGASRTHQAEQTKEAGDFAAWKTEEIENDMQGV